MRQSPSPRSFGQSLSGYDELRLLRELRINLRLGGIIGLGSFTLDSDDPFLLCPLRLVDNDVLQVKEVEGPHDLPLSFFEAFLVGIVDGLVHLIFELDGGIISLHCPSHLFLSHFDYHSLLLDHLGPTLGQLELYLQGAYTPLLPDRLGSGLDEAFLQEGGILLLFGYRCLTVAHRQLELTDHVMHLLEVSLHPPHPCLRGR